MKKQIMEKKYKIKELKESFNGLYTLAHQLADEGWITFNKNILKLKDYNGKTVAHYMVEYGFTDFKDFEILSLADNNGWTVAHELVKCGIKFNDKNILKLKDNNNHTVAHIQAEHGWITKDEELLKLKNNKGLTVAHIIANNNKDVMFLNSDILNLADNDGWTVMHSLARNKYIFTQPNVWNISTNENNVSIAHVMIYSSGYTFKYKKILLKKILLQKQQEDLPAWFLKFGIIILNSHSLSLSFDTREMIIEAKLIKDIYKTVPKKFNKFKTEKMRKYNNFYKTLNILIKKNIKLINMC
ncbi:hypothetical protein DEFDS_P114 (plasmid) [Deferribacter desulfuricans SSM1]|uniref:Ankyrin repeat protein n=1 Tax=Deferribacter desulfuricans (strain DSM 14783 / JCM 11476 / NBRC 101012 / SSM1) TaxID=639282 RepID=D3PEU4_DEFDS|nr:hypothetical protein [Deferribacter desulfuricans]BAI81736.1 hypothetical protein DEFDS_P114 [Deferribacter desulfuricans SSM1]